MSKSVNRSNEVVYGNRSGILVDEAIEYAVVWIGEEYRLHVCIVDSDMLHAVLFFILTGQFVFLDHSCEIVIDVGTYY